MPGPTSPVAQTQQIQLTGGYYVARSRIANYQKCLNLYPEKNPEDSPVKFTNYPRPGLRQLRQAGTANAPPVGVSRGGYVSSTGVLFVCCASDLSGISTLYMVDEDWRYHALGDLTLVLNSSGVPATNPVSMFDNGFELVLVDGSANGYQVSLTTFVMTAIVDAAFYGADKVGYLDTRLIFNRPGTKRFYAGPVNAVTPFDATYTASKTGLPDNLGTIAVMHREIWLLGQRWSSEVWYNAGGSSFPYQITPGVFIEQGCIGIYSVAQHDLSIFFMSRDRDGQVTVCEGTKYSAVRVSTPAIEVLLSRQTNAALAAAVGMIYKQQGHVFYLLTVGDVTVVYDKSEGLWHEEAWTDNNGVDRPHRANWITMAYGKVVAGDRLNGNLYQLDQTCFFDEVEGTNRSPGEADSASPIVRRRGFPQLQKDGVTWQHAGARLDIETGMADSEVEELDTQIFLRWSDDRGKTWSQPVPQSIGLMGQYALWPRWPPLGLSRARIYEVFWSTPADTALNSLWVDLVKTQGVN